MKEQDKGEKEKKKKEEPDTAYEAETHRNDNWKKKHQMEKKRTHAEFPCRGRKAMAKKWRTHS